MESKRINNYVSGFLFSVLALFFLPSCVVPPSRKEREKPEISREKKEKQKVEWKEEVEERKNTEAETKEDSRTGITWVEIKGGGFQMGSDTGDSDEGPVRQVNIKTFWMAKTEVTVAQYKKCVDAGKCKKPPTGSKYYNWGQQPRRNNHPVNGMNWTQAREYCEWAGGRLPSEAEWEYAARSGGQNITYPWGNDTATCDYAVMDDGGNGCGTDRTWPVCSKPAGNTDQGLCDMAGNVWDWMEDDYHSDYNGAPSDGSAWVDEPRGSYRVKRGGSFYSTADSLRAADRVGDVPSYDGGYGYGVRCARDAP